MRYLPFLFAVLLLASCGTRKKNTNSGDDIAQLTAAEQVMQKLEGNHFSADWMDARASMKLESPQLNASGTAYIRLEKDKRLWVSVKKFGFEAARALITPDSFYVINRLSNEYSADPLTYVTDRFGIPARFDLLQEIVLGNPVFFDRNLELVDNADAYKLNGEDSRWVSNYYVNKETYLLNSMRLKQRAENQEVSVFMDDYQATELGKPFAVKRFVEINSPKTGLAKIKMDFTKVAFNEEVSMPFNVPAKFKP